MLNSQASRSRLPLIDHALYEVLTQKNPKQSNVYRISCVAQDTRFECASFFGGFEELVHLHQTRAATELP